MRRKPDAARWEGWRRRLRRFERGRATVADFCGREGVSVATFYQWRRKLRAKGADSLPPDGLATPSGIRATSRRAGGTPGFVPVEITVPSPAIAPGPSCVEVLLPGGARLLVPCHAHEAIRAVVATLMSAGWEDRPC